MYYKPKVATTRGVWSLLLLLLQLLLLFLLLLDDFHGRLFLAHVHRQSYSQQDVDDLKHEQSDAHASHHVDVALDQRTDLHQTTLCVDVLLKAGLCSVGYTISCMYMYTYM